MRIYPLSIFRVFRAPDDGAGEGAGNPAPQPQSTQLNAEQIATIVAAVEARQQRAGNAAARAMAEQYGMSADELTAILQAKKAEKANAIPEAAQRQIDAANAQLQKYQLSGEVQKLGAAMGLLDADAAIQLMDHSKVTYKDGKHEGVQDALNQLKEAKPYLFKAAEPAQPQGAWGQHRQGGAPDSNTTTARDEMRKALFGH